jgi:hypothetical protein
MEVLLCDMGKIAPSAHAVRMGWESFLLGEVEVVVGQQLHTLPKLDAGIEGLQGVEQNIRIEAVLTVVGAVNALVAQDDSELHDGIS